MGGTKWMAMQEKNACRSIKLIGILSGVHKLNQIQLSHDKCEADVYLSSLK